MDEPSARRHAETPELTGISTWRLGGTISQFEHENLLGLAVMTPARRRSFQSPILVWVIWFLCGMQIGLRHFDSRTLDWLAVALRCGGSR